jgi:hypothetical protein
MWGRTNLLSGGLLVQNLQAEALKFLFVVAKEFSPRPAFRCQVRVITYLAF